ncbi:TonB-dependent receptor [Novosphingobium marinum]|uniref:Iron complex outermembrane receptor protein n=1 Tax=Novosphingobium marinum TaxID=1514948 RepID=A0A7Y9XT47_9SPHN|nr:TonB-dependent receptor [Novosphingobium marinum]NYH94060.1 iron complex outermembrane receptor protein [Novosphingobium marinum]GGC19289.1 TonB-dependent receptor [Novosphingobium marinum]
MRKNFARRLVSVALASSAISIAAPALAQEVDTDTVTDPEGPTNVGGPIAQSANEIIVTARRRNESLQETPVAVTAINAAMLENKGTLNIGELQGQAPNLLITQQAAGASAANLSIRGLTYADVEKSQEPTVGVVVDGVFLGTSTGQFLDFFDVEQIEVLRGPQGTLFGRNTIGGVINIRRTRPTMELGGKFEYQRSKFNTEAIRAVMNFGLADGMIGIKPFWFRSESDGFYTQAQTGERRGGYKNDTYGVAIAVQPSDNFDILITGEKLESTYDPVTVSIARTGELFCDFVPAEECNRNTTTDLYTTFLGDQGGKYSAPALTVEANLEVADIKFTSVTGYRKSSENQLQDFDTYSVDLYVGRRIQSYEQFSQELRASGDFGSRFDYVVGLYYFKSDYSLTQYTKVFGFSEGVDPRDFDSDPQLVDGGVKSYAVFGDFNWEFIDRFRLSFGGRYTHDKKYLNNGFLLSGLIGEGRDTFKKFTPKVGIDFRPNDDLMFYASWSQGFRSGGFSPRAQTAETAALSFSPEVVDSYEVGAKMELFDRLLAFNIAGFVSKYDGLQQNTTIPGGPTGNQTITSNVGSATIKGIEADFTVTPTYGLRINGAIGWLDAEFDDFIAGNTLDGATLLPFDYSNNEPIYSPDLTASFGATYTQPVGAAELVASVNYRFIDRYDQQISLGGVTGDLVNGPVVVTGNAPQVRTDKQNLLDASLTVNFELGGTVEAYATAFARNLLDDRGMTSGFTVAGLWSFATAREPRTYGFTVGMRF